MGLIALEKALNVLRPHLDPLHGCIETAWNEVQKYPERLRLIQDCTARANNMACEMKFAATQYFCQQTDVRIEVVHRATMYVVADCIALRFKKLDRDLLTHNIPTYQAMAISHQHSDVLGPVTFLNVGYVLDQTDMRIDRICMTCPNGDNRNFWEYDLQRSIEVTKILDLYAAHSDADEPETKVRGKKESEDRKDEDQS